MSHVLAIVIVLIVALIIILLIAWSWLSEEDNMGTPGITEIRSIINDMRDILKEEVYWSDMRALGDRIHGMSHYVTVLSPSGEELCSNGAFRFNELNYPQLPEVVSVMKGDERTVSFRLSDDGLHSAFRINKDDRHVIVHVSI